MCERDMFNTPTFSGRAQEVLLAGKERGLDRPLVVALTALSEGETGGVWLTKRPGLVEGEGCCAVIVGLEHGQFSTAITKDNEAISWLADRGWIDQVEQEGGTSAGQFVLKPINGLGNPLKPQKTMLFFEWVFATRKEHLLPIFSIGPTQMHLAWFKERCGWPQNWDELWDLYAAGSTWELSDSENFVSNAERITYFIERWLTYLTPKSVYQSGCLSPSVPLPNGSESAGVSWLTTHAGKPQTAKKLWASEKPFQNRRAYRDVWAEVNLQAQQLGY